MNQTARDQWGRQEQQFGGMGASTEDFADFLDLDNIDMNFPMYDNNNGTNGIDMPNAHQPQNHEGMLGSADASGMLDMRHYGEMQTMPVQMDGLQHGTTQRQVDGQTAAMDFAMAHQYTQDAHQYQMPSVQHFQPQFGIPATPNSAEMHPHYMRQHGMDSNAQFAMEQQYQMRKDDVVG